MKQLKNFLIKREQSQACLSFAKREKSRLLAKTLLTLVALLAVTTGAWAEDETLLTTITPTGDGTYSETTAGAVTVTPAGSFFYSGSSYGWRWDNYGSLTVTANEGYTIARCVFIQQGNNQSVTISDAPFALNFEENLCLENTSMDGVTSIEVYGTAPAAASGTPVPLNWDATAKTATLTNGMPAGNVTVSVEYYPQATAEGAVTEATDVKATTDAPLVTIDETKLTGVAKMMYYVSADADATAPAYDAEGWTDKVPTAEKFTQAQELKVWYYPVGADSDDPAKTYSDGDMNATALAVSLGDAPTYDVTLNAEGLSADEAAAWKVAKGTDDPAAFPLKGVTKGETVTVTYSGTRKVIGVKAEKKSSAPTLKDALADGATVVINYTWFGTNVTTFTYTNNAGTFTGNATGIEAEYFDNGMSMDGTTLKFTASNKDMSDANVSIDFNTDTNGYVANKGSAFTSFTISVNGTEISVSEVVVEVVDETGD